MGGFGSGGRRSGAGRKTKAAYLRAIDGGAGRRGDDQGAGAELSEPLEAPTFDVPAHFSDAERAVWEELLPLAIAEKTLTTSTLRSFVQLVEAEADRRDLRVRYLERKVKPLVLGLDDDLALRREHRALLKDINARMKDFKLAPFGKEILAGAGDAGGGTEADPLDAFTRR